MANKVYNVNGGLHSAAALGALEGSMYGSSVASSTDFVATAGTGMNVELSTGNGLIDTGTGYAHRIGSDATNTIALDAASANDRIDAIVAYIDNAVTPTTTVTDNTNNILCFTAVTGTPASTPVAPNSTAIQSAIGAGNPYMVLWEVTVPANATALTGATFTDKRVIAAPSAGISALSAQLSALTTSLTLSNFTSHTFTSSELSNNITSGGTIYLAQSADSSTFKAYGNLYLKRTQNSSASFTLTSIPGLSGYYGIKTSLKLDYPPTTGYNITPAGNSVRVTAANDNATGAYMVAMAIGTDGYVYLGSNTSNTVTVSATSELRWIFYPCLYFNTNFGDVA